MMAHILVKHVKNGAIKNLQRPIARSLQLSSYFKPTDIDNCPDIQSIQAVHSALKEVPSTPTDKVDIKALVNNSLAVSESLTKVEFESILSSSIDVLQVMQNDSLSDFKFSPVAEELSKDKVTGLQYLCMKYKLKDLARYFDVMDKNKDGIVSSKDLIETMDVFLHGDNEAWLKYQCMLFDNGNSGAMNETQTQQVFSNILGVQRLAMKEIFNTYTQNMTKVHEKQLEKSLNEVEWNLKVPEKIRCMYHFGKQDKETTISIPDLLSAQQTEFPEFDTMLAHYANGFLEDRREFYVKRDEKRNLYRKSFAFTLFIGVSEFLVLQL